MRFSFIIPTKNEGGYLDGCLKSIRKQGVKDYEIIVVDTHSNDGTARIARAHGAKVVTEGRKGPAIARNTGAKMAAGDILVFADADVRFESDFLERVAKKFSGNLGGAIFRLELHDSCSRAIWLSYKIANCIVNTLCRLGRAVTLGSCFAFKKSIFDSVGGFDPSLMTNEDHDLAMRISKKKPFRYFHDIVVCTSCRRVAKYGLLNMIAIYAKSASVFFLKHRSLPGYWS